MFDWSTLCVRLCVCLCPHWLAQCASLSAECCLAEVYSRLALHQIHPDTQFSTASLLFVTFARTCHTIWQPSALPKCTGAAGHHALAQHTALSITQIDTHQSTNGYFTAPAGCYMVYSGLLCTFGSIQRAVSCSLSWPWLWPSCGNGTRQQVKRPTGSLHH